jgi:AAA+ ATPase superfamily predicted ATPase
MKFYDRENELKLLHDSSEIAKKTARFTVLIGRRRVGKTGLLLESEKGRSSLYCYISRKSEDLLCEEFQNEAVEHLGIEIYGTISRFEDLFSALLKFSEHTSFTLILDEFQEFKRVNPSIFGSIQKLWDLRKRQSKMNLIVCGSVYSMMIDLFENDKEPLFGRLTSKIVLQPFETTTIREILSDYNPDYTPEDLLCLFMITGGIPKYIELLMDAGAFTKSTMLKTVTASGSPFLNEGRELLIAEFGKDHATYLTILQQIARGKTSQSEIDSVTGKNTGVYLNNLAHEYSIIERRTPMFSKPDCRKGKWRIKDPFLLFWFRFIFSRSTLVEMKRGDLLLEEITKNYDQFSGQTLVTWFSKKISESQRVTELGAYWDRKGENEIDLIALNELDRTAQLYEIKRNPKKINLKVLSSKALRIQSELSLYETTYHALSLEDM